MMDLKDVITKVAPTLGSVLLGPLGGVAVSFLADKLGVEEKTVTAVTAAISDGKMSPEQLLAVKSAEMDFQKFCKVNNVDLEAIAAKDRDGARQMQIATKSNMPAILTLFVTVGFFGILTLLFFHPELKGNEIVMIMVGQLSAVWASCVAFWVGTTNNSLNKTNLLAQSSPK